MENKILNLGILAHVDAGKTTLTESLLYHSGIIRKMGNVDKGTTVTDSMSLEQERGMTIQASTVSFSLEGIKVNLIDTPGHADFFGEVERSLSVLDGVILVLSAVEGVQTQTRILFQYLERMGIPMCIFINKLDRIGADSGKVCEQIRKQLSPHIVLMQETVAEGGRDCRIRAYDRQEEPFTQQVISQSDALMEKYIDDIPISGEELDEAMKLLVQKGELYPVYAGAALHDIGVAELIKGMTTWLPCSGSGEGDRELSAYVYKIEFEEDGRKKAYIRVYEGALTRKDRVRLADRELDFVVNNLSTVRDGKQVAISKVSANDIAILSDIPHIKCGDFLGRRRIRKGTPAREEPMLRIVVRPIRENQRFFLLEALKELESEDPLLHIRIHRITQEIQVSLFGKLQIEILTALLRERYGIAVSFSGASTICKAKPAEKAFMQIRMNEPGNLHRAGIALLLEPLPTGTGNQYETRVSYGFLEKPFQNAVREGVEKALEDGDGDGIVDTKVTFLDADYDSVTSTPADYRRLAPQVIRRGLAQAGLLRMEPIMTYQLLAPSVYERKLIGELGKMSASVEEVTFTGDEMTVKGQVPYDTAKDFPIQLKSMSGGKGVFEMRFLEYRCFSCTRERK